MKREMLSLIIVAMFVTSFLAYIPTAVAYTTKLMVIPQLQEFGAGNVDCVGTHFQITCEVFNVTNLFGVDIQIGWDTNWIRYLNHTAHIPVETYPDGILHEPPAGIWVKNDVDETASMAGSAAGTMYWLSYASFAGATPFDGDGVCFDMWFNITNQPPEGDPDEYVTIEFTSSTLANELGNPIDHDPMDGTVRIHALEHELPPEPMLKVLPEEVDGTYAELFTIDIWLMDEFGGDLDPEWDPGGFDIHLNFNTTLMQGLAVTIDPDGWFASFWPGGVFVVKSESDNVAGDVWMAFVGIPGPEDIPVPDAPGHTMKNHTYPYGQGRLAEITFNATYEQIPPPFDAPCCDLTINCSSVIAGFPHPERPYLPWRCCPWGSCGCESSVPLPHKKEHGKYCAPLKLLGPAIDVWACNYPDDYNGKGIGKNSDLVWPQKEVCLCALVTYNEWPEQQKDVAFQLLDPYGETFAIFYNRTDENGMACVIVRMPWPCDDPEYWFGEWTVIATVDVACQWVNDTLKFKYDYFVNIWKVTVDQDAYAHCETIAITIEYGTYWMQAKSALFTVTATDDSGVPFGFAWTWDSIGEAEYCTYANGTIVLYIHVVKWTRAGIATLYINALGDWPELGGYPYYPVASVQVSILAEWA